MIPGEYKLKDEPILCNSGKQIIKIEVVNQGDRPVQVGSHYHFYEVNQFLYFDRLKAYGKRLDIPAGTAVRFEPGDSKSVKLVPFSGERKIYGLNNKTNSTINKDV
ncbi:urease subunit beta [Caldibacillus thermoamylovorans]|jgi:urease subunit beta